ncbi:MAG: metallophosphoesterase [Herbinix sp.]|nr:metallophosphoesterase [Herbinix sp.]
MHIGIIVAGLIMIFIIWTVIEQKQLVTTKYVVASAKLPKALNSTSFVVLADLHNYNFGKNNERLVKRIDELSPEFIIIAGDMINKSAACYPSNVFRLLEQLAKRYKIFYAYGNHEQRMDRILEMNINQNDLSSTWVEFKKILTNLGVIFLDNKSTVFIKNKEKLRITGVSIGREYFIRGKIPAMEEGYIRSLIGEKTKKEYQILIAHNPVYFSEYANWGADLTISGHLHGGLVRLPGVGGVISPQVKLFPKYNSGNFAENGQQMVVSRGLGSHSMMPRVFNAPEIVYITMKNQD